MESTKYNIGDKFAPVVGQKIKCEDGEGNFFVGYIKEITSSAFFVHHPYKDFAGPSGVIKPERYSFKFVYLPHVTRPFTVLEGSEEEDEEPTPVIEEAKEGGPVTPADALYTQEIIIKNNLGVVLKKEEVFIPENHITLGSMSYKEFLGKLQSLEDIRVAWNKAFNPRPTIKKTYTTRTRSKKVKSTEDEKITATASLILLIEGIMRDKNLSLREISLQSKISDRTLGNILNGTSLASQRTARAIQITYSKPWNPIWDKLMVGKGRVAQHLLPNR